MKLFAALLVTGALIAGPAFAQQDTAAPQDHATQSDTTPAKPAKPKVKDVVAQCREEAKAQGLKGEDRKNAVLDCVTKKRPALAALIACRQDPNLKGLDKEARKAAIKDCVKNKK